MKKVFIVQFDWSTPDSGSVDLYAFQLPCSSCINAVSVSAAARCPANEG